jgi:hypothetical protein
LNKVIFQGRQDASKDGQGLGGLPDSTQKRHATIISRLLKISRGKVWQFQQSVLTTLEMSASLFMDGADREGERIVAKSKPHYSINQSKFRSPYTEAT